MVRSTFALASGALLLAMIAPPGSAAAPAAADGPAARLSPSQAAVISGAIAKLKSPQERSLASAWTDAKKVAEFICRPQATTVLKRRFNADRVFLGTDDPSTLELRSDAQLTGNGQYRAGSKWRTFAFSCVLDPRKGTATSFQTTAAPADQVP
jgi:hypothetical protein